jgi:hypothetical protein
MMSYRADNLPKILNRLTDIEIPLQVRSSWKPAVGDRRLVRALTEDERGALEARRNELQPAAAPYVGRDRDRVVLAIADMFGGFTSMRQSDDEAASRLDTVIRLLEPFPAWAIEKACRGVQMNGVLRNGDFDRKWPPNDSEIVDVVRKEAKLYSDQYESAVALLAATVEE